MKSSLSSEQYSTLLKAIDGSVKFIAKVANQPNYMLATELKVFLMIAIRLSVL